MADGADPRRAAAPAVHLRWWPGSREPLRALFELAEDSPRALASYLDCGRVLVAADGEGQAVGYLQLVDAGRPAELKSMAVAEGRQRSGVGRALVDRAVAECRAAGWDVLLVATAAADIGNLRFYQRLGFRMLRIDRDAFTPATGYPDGLDVDGIPLRDRVWLSLDLA